MSGLISATAAIAWKDLRAEFRNRQVISAMGLFALIAALIFYFTLDGERAAQIAALPAILWVIVTFAGTLGLSRSLAAERETGTLDALLLTPIPRAALFYGKLISAWLFTLIVAAVASFVLSIVFNADLFDPGLVLVWIVGTLGFATIGTLLGSIAVQGGGRETTLPILILPIALPLIIAAVHATSDILGRSTIDDWRSWLGAIASIDVLYLVLGFFLFDVIVEE